MGPREIVRVVYIGKDQIAMWNEQMHEEVDKALRSQEPVKILDECITFTADNVFSRPRRNAS
jgi:hypothetical protein